MWLLSLTSRIFHILRFLVPISSISDYWYAVTRFAWKCKAGVLYIVCEPVFRVAIRYIYMYIHRKRNAFARFLHDETSRLTCVRVFPRFSYPLTSHAKRYDQSLSLSPRSLWTFTSERAISIFNLITVFDACMILSRLIASSLCLVSSLYIYLSLNMFLFFFIFFDSIGMNFSSTKMSSFASLIRIYIKFLFFLDRQNKILWENISNAKSRFCVNIIF